MAEFANAFHIAVGDQITRIVVKDVNLEGERESIVSDLALMTVDALTLAHKIIELHNEQSGKTLAAAQAQNGSGETPAVETVN